MSTTKVMYVVRLPRLFCLSSMAAVAWFCHAGVRTAWLEFSVERLWARQVARHRGFDARPGAWSMDS